MRDGPQLITYPDSLGGTVSDIVQLMQGPLAGLFPGGVHVLPPFPSSGDRGFAPTRYDVIDSRFGTREDLQTLAKIVPLTLDVMVNHISAQSPQFLDFQAYGRGSEWADVFITVEKVFGDRPPSRDELAATALRRPDGPLLDVPIAADGTTEAVWATFADRSTGRCEQIDLDLTSPLARELVAGWFRELADLGACTVRLDAVGYVTKRSGSSSFMIEPDIWERMADLTRLAAGVGLDVLPEVHDALETHRELVQRGYRTYDYVLPALVLDALLTGEADTLADHLRHSPRMQVTTLDTHDGIPIMPDMAGVLPNRALGRVVEWCVDRGANVARVFNPPPGMFDIHQINITYRDAVAGDDAYLAARALQLFAPGRPQIYYVGLLAGRNDEAARAATGDGRSINRHNFTCREIAAATNHPVVQSLFELIRLRAEHPAFGGTPSFEADGSHIRCEWRAADHSARLSVDLANPAPVIDAT